MLIALLGMATNIIVEAVSPTKAHVTHDLVVLEVADEPRIIATGRYDKSVVVKTANGWRFESRKLHVDPGFFQLMKRLEAESGESPGHGG